jgi:hypothetical protein
LTREAGKEVLELCKLDLRPGLIRFRARDEYIKNESASIEHFALENLLEVSDLDGVQIVVEDHKLYPLVQDHLVDFLDLSFPYEGRSIDPFPVLANPRDDFRAGSVCEERQFIEVLFGFFAADRPRGDTDKYALLFAAFFL